MRIIQLSAEQAILSERQIYAAYDEAGIHVYQAFTPSIVQAALAKGTFGAGFGLDRMTWIKPSLGWMLYRSGYASKHNQEAIIRVKLSHAGFREILRRSVETSFNPQIYASEGEWKRALDASTVRHQWDPERDIKGPKLERRAIQIGIRGETVHTYVNEWIIGLEDVTPLARAIHEAIRNHHLLPNVPEERHYPVDDRLRQSLGVWTSAE